MRRGVAPYVLLCRLWKWSRTQSELSLILLFRAMLVHATLLGGVLSGLRASSHFFVLLILAWGHISRLALDPGRLLCHDLAILRQIRDLDNFGAVSALAIVNILILCFDQ